MPRRIHGSGATCVEVRYNRTVGIDTDSKFLVTAFFDSSSPIVPTTEYEQSQSGVVKLVQDVIAFGAERIVIESTANYHMMAYDGLRAANQNAVVINPLRVKALLRVEGKSDRADAVTLARLAASFDMRPSNMPDDLQREARTYWRQIDLDKNAEQRILQRLTAMLIAHGTTATRIVSNKSKVYLEVLQRIAAGDPPESVAEAHPRAQFRERLRDSINPELPDYVRLAVGDTLENIAYLRRRSERYAELLQDLMARFQDQVRLMCTVPAVTPRLCWRVIAEMGDNYHERYPDMKSFCRGIGVVPSNVVSGGKLLKREATHGNMRVKIHLLNNVKAWVIRPHDGPLYAWYRSYLSRTNYMRATSSLAHKVAEGLFIVQYLVAEFDEYKYFRRQRPTRHLKADPITGEILDEAPIGA